MGSNQLKVFSWIGRRTGVTVNPDAPWNHQTREVVAARSKAEVGRIVGQDPRNLFNLGETGNKESVDLALSKPGVVFWRGLDDRAGEWKQNRPTGTVTP